MNFKKRIIGFGVSAICVLSLSMLNNNALAAPDSEDELFPYMFESSTDEYSTVEEPPLTMQLLDAEDRTTDEEFNQLIVNYFSHFHRAGFFELEEYIIKGENYNKRGIALIKLFEYIDGENAVSDLSYIAEDVNGCSFLKKFVKDADKSSPRMRQIIILAMLDNALNAVNVPNNGCNYDYNSMTQNYIGVEFILFYGKLLLTNKVKPIDNFDLLRALNAIRSYKFSTIGDTEKAYRIIEQFCQIFNTSRRPINIM